MSKTFMEGIKQEQTWVISKKLIEKLNIKPAGVEFGIKIEGEDGKWYSLDEVFIAIFERIEKMIGGEK